MIFNYFDDNMLCTRLIYPLMFSQVSILYIIGHNSPIVLNPCLCIVWSSSIQSQICLVLNNSFPCLILCLS